MTWANDRPDFMVNGALQPANRVQDLRHFVGVGVSLGALVPYPLPSTESIHDAWRLLFGPFEHFLQTATVSVTMGVMTLEARPATGDLPDFGTAFVQRIGVISVMPGAFDRVHRLISVLHLGIDP